MRLSYSGLVCLPSKEDTVSSNLISRSTVNAFTKKFSPSADPRYSYWVSRIFFVIMDFFSPYTGTHYVYIARCVESDGVVNNSNVYDSYGRRSPSTYFVNRIAWYVWTDGDVDYDDVDGVDYSYGNLLLRSYIILVK